MKTLIIESCFLSLLVAPLHVTAKKEIPKDKPNILFILSDDHTSQAWGIYGGIISQYVKNENIRKLASEGCVLDNCFCTNSLCAPSRASIITGRYSQLNGVRLLEDALSPQLPNIAKSLQSGGYQTGLVGKWHLKKEPTGFDYFAVFSGQGTYRNPIFKTKGNWVDDGKNDKNVGEKTQGYSTDIITDKVIKWIQERDKNKPFMMFCHFKATHEPWDYPERMKDLYKDVVFPEPSTLFEFGTEKTGRAFLGQTYETLAERFEKRNVIVKGSLKEPGFTTKGLDSVAARKKVYQRFMQDYLRCGAAIDDNIGRLLKTLDGEGIKDNTIVVYVSDQGYFMGEHGFMDKRIMYEEPLRMPFVIRYPKEIPAGTRNRDIILNVDFASLLADYGGVEPPEGVQGISFRENLNGHTPRNWRKEMYYRYWTQQIDRPAHIGIRNERYKLIFFYGDGLKTKELKFSTTPAWEFHDLKMDPTESKNTYNNPQYASIIKDMKKELLRLREQYKDTDESTPRMKEIMDKYYW